MVGELTNAITRAERFADLGLAGCRPPVDASGTHRLLMQSRSRRAEAAAKPTVAGRLIPAIGMSPMQSCAVRPPTDESDR